MLPTNAPAQVKTVAQYIDDVKAITDRADLKAANDYIDRNHESILHEWIAITEINAPSGQEQQRAKYIESLLRKYHLDDVHYDSAGNLIAVRRGAGGGPLIVFDAHMDTVFQPGLQIKATIRDGKVYAPGIGDDTRNVEALLATIRALNEAKIKTKGDLVFVFTVEEETTFKGVKTYVNENKARINHYIALDGGYEGFTYAGIGINWYRHHFIGPGGHTRSSTPPYSATLPLARAIVRMTVKTDVISTSPAALIPGHRNSEMVKIVEAVHLAMGFVNPPITNTGSNNSSAALLAGIPSISTGAGPCGDSHALTEWCEIEPFYKGTKKIILMELALAQMSDK